VSGTGLDARVGVERSSGFRLDISLALPAGVTVCLLGPNGSGKSTGVAALAGLLPISWGRISLNGQILDDPAGGVFVPAERRRIGVVFQDYLLFPHLDVLDNVAFGLRAGDVPRGEALARAGEALSRMGLRGLEHRKPGALSGGQAQRVALARALVIDPDLLLLDEPLAALDVSTRAELREQLEEHLTMFAGPRLLITHEPSDAFLLSERIDIIEQGAVSQSGTAESIRLRPATRYAADLVGSNFVRARVTEGLVDTGGHRLLVADEVADGPVLVTIHPSAISIHTHRPEGSPRNAWRTTVTRVEHLGGRARLLVGDPLPLTVELTEAATAELHLKPGSEIWVAVKATEIGVQPAGRTEPGVVATG